MKKDSLSFVKMYLNKYVTLLLDVYSWYQTTLCKIVVSY